jgi:hypothetical protein
MLDAGSPPRRESLARVLLRNVVIALLVGAVAAAVRRDPTLVARVGALALWFSLGGHFVERLFLDEVRPRVSSVESLQRVTRFATWFVGGAVLYSLMTLSAEFVAPRALSWRWWWLGGFAFIAVELFVHALLALRRRPNFYRGDA